jgi:hypothetical protein
MAAAENQSTPTLAAHDRHARRTRMKSLKTHSVQQAASASAVSVHTPSATADHTPLPAHNLMAATENNAVNSMLPAAAAAVATAPNQHPNSSCCCLSSLLPTSRCFLQALQLQQAVD